MLPALPAELTDDLPTVDQERLATFDDQLRELVEAVGERGFSESTVRWIFAARERLYAERGTAWNRLVLYGEPLAQVERFAEDESSARRWVWDRLRAAAWEHVADTVRTGRPGGRDPRYKPLPFFEEWLESRDVDFEDERSERAVIGAHRQYTAWLDAHGDTVVSEAEHILASQSPMSLRGSVARAAGTAASQFRSAVFDEFDGLFALHLQRGIVQVRAIEPLPPPRVDNRGLLSRIFDRVFDVAPAVIEDRKSLEYEALSSFFEVARTMSDMIGSLAAASAVTQVVDEFKWVTGLNELEATVLGTAKARLDQLVNHDTAFAFLSGFDHELGHPAGRTRPDPGRDSSATGHARNDDTVDVGPDPVTFATAASGASVTFTRSALEDDAWSHLLYDHVADLLGRVISHHAIAREFVEALCREAYDVLSAPDRDQDDAQLAKRVLRRLALLYHPDAHVAGGNRNQTDETNARTLSRLLALHRDGHLEIRATNATTITIWAWDTGSS